MALKARNLLTQAKQNWRSEVSESIEKGICVW